MKRGKGWSVNREEELARSFSSLCGTLTLTSSGLRRPTPFLPPLFSLFPGATYITHRGPPSTVWFQQGRELSPGWHLGQRAGRDPDCLLETESTHASFAGPFVPAAGDGLGLPARGETGRRHTPGVASPAAPRVAGRRPPPSSPPPRVPEAQVPGPAQQWRSRKLAPRLPQAHSGLRPACGRDGKAAASAFLLPAWRWVGSRGLNPGARLWCRVGCWWPFCPRSRRRWPRRRRTGLWRDQVRIPGNHPLSEPRTSGYCPLRPRGASTWPLGRRPDGIVKQEWASAKQGCPGRADRGEVLSGAASGAGQVWFGDQARSTLYGKKSDNWFLRVWRHVRLGPKLKCTGALWPVDDNFFVLTAKT